MSEDKATKAKNEEVKKEEATEKKKTAPSKKAEAKKETKKPGPSNAQKKQPESKAKPSIPQGKGAEKAKDTKAAPKSKEPKGEERFYTFNLRDAYAKPRKKRAKTAVRILRELIARHMKAANVKITNALNAELWKHSADKPPRKVKVKVRKEGDIATAEKA